MDSGCHSGQCSCTVMLRDWKSLASFHFDRTYLKCEKIYLKLNFLRRVFQNPNKQAIKTTIYFSFQTYLNQSLPCKNTLLEVYCYK